jgi:hypothetical protein
VKDRLSHSGAVSKNWGTEQSAALAMTTESKPLADRRGISMKRTAGALVLLAALSGCMAMDGGPEMATAPHVGCGGGRAHEIPGVQGPWGQPVAMAMPYAAGQSPGAAAAQAMMARSVPLDLVQQSSALQGLNASGITQAGAWMDPTMSSGVVPAGGDGPPSGPGLAPPGMPGPPCPPGMAPPAGFPPGAVAAVGALPPGMPSRFPTKRTEVRFVGPDGMKISWFAPGPDGKPGFTSTQPLEAPARYNFPQAAIYRLKLTHIPNRPGLELYPTLEVVPSNLKTDPFLAHSAVPVNFTEEDFEQVAAGNYLVKVIYLPDPGSQEFATTGPDEVVSSRLEPGVDPIAEARRRGCILLVIRLGNIDLEAPNTPAMDAPSPYQLKPMMPPFGGPGAGMPQPGPMIPYGMGPGKPMAMGPNSPLLMMGPNGQLMWVGPNGPMPGPGGPAGPPAVLPPPTSPAKPPASAPTTTTPPVSQQTGTSGVQQAAYTTPTPAQLVNQDSAAAPSKPASSHHWWFN